jgi:hypothetical protein
MARRLTNNNKGIASKAGGGMYHWAGSEPVRALHGRASSDPTQNTLIEEDEMIVKIPVSLKKEPLLEAIWEIRFSSDKPSVAELLPGMLFSSNSLPQKYGNIVRLPAADIPAAITEQDQSLRYVPKIRLENGNQAVQIGEHVVSLNCRRPYSGWSIFKGYTQSRRSASAYRIDQAIRAVFVEVHRPHRTGPSGGPRLSQSRPEIG